MPIPLNGQGNPLPPNFPYRGEWILEPRMFLYVPDQAESTASNAPRFTASLNDNRDDWCFGFDSEQLATALNITTDSLFQANRHRKLTLVAAVRVSYGVCLGNASSSAREEDWHVHYWRTAFGNRCCNSDP